MNDIASQPIHWAGPGLTRIPFALYSDAQTASDEQARIFRGEVWNYLCLEAELPDAGSYRTTFAGETPVVVVRDEDGEIYAFENRCAHRGALIALEKSGRAENFQCVYHAWSYNRQGDLTGVAFEKGVKGQGGMPPDFCKEAHGPRKLRIATFCGLVFGSFSEDVPGIEDYLGEEICARIERVLHKPVEVIGRFTQALPNNWKLYVENVKDTYHASLLHTFFSTFHITRLTQGGGVLVSPDGAHHASSTVDRGDDRESSAYRDQDIRSEKARYRLNDPSLLDTVKEFGDDIQLQILTVFPGLVVQQVYNALAVRQVLPKGPNAMELHWTYLGFTDDTPEMRRRRLRQANLVGPAGYVSMEDGCVGGFVQRGAAAAGDTLSVINMGGEGAESQDTRATEAAVRGFWKAYRRYMGY